MSRGPGPQARTRGGRAAAAVIASALLALGPATGAAAVAGSSRIGRAVNNRQRPRRRPRTATNPFGQRAVRRYLSHRAANVTAAVYDVRTGVSYLYRPGVHEQTASIVKVDILATLLHQAQRRGQRLSAAETGLAPPMIEVSDNDAAQQLWDLAGGAGGIGPFDQSIGLTQTAPNVNGHFGLTWTTAPDQIRLLGQVMLPGGVLDQSSRNYEYELMLNVTPSQRWGVSAGVPAGARVALKDGWLPRQSGWQVNSIGSIVGSGRRYLIAVLTDDDPSWDYGIATIQHLSAATWQALR